MLLETAVVDLPVSTGRGRPDHFAIRHKPSGRLLAWDDTLTPNPGEAVRFSSPASAERRVLMIEPAAQGEYETVGLRYELVAGV